MNEAMDIPHDPSYGTAPEIPGSDESQSAPGIGVLVEFRCRGLARFLSHAELMRVFQRACVRANLALEYSRGFNPRPRLSLPLPKPVGVESEADLLYLRWKDPGIERGQAAAGLKHRLSEQLPGGLEVLSVRIVSRKASYQAEAADYRFPLKADGVSDEEMRMKIQTLLARGEIGVDRRDGEGGKARRVDVRPFLESIEVAGREIKVRCRIFQTGSIRVGEILELLGLNKEQLAGPVCRTAIVWRPSLSNECDSDPPSGEDWKGS